MAEQSRSRTLMEEHWEEPPRKRLRSNSQGEHFAPATDIDHDHHTISFAKDKALPSVSAAKLAPHTVAPFLAKHVPTQYAPLGDETKIEIRLINRLILTRNTVTDTGQTCYVADRQMNLLWKRYRRYVKKLVPRSKLTGHVGDRGHVPRRSTSYCPSVVAILCRTVETEEFDAPGILAQCCFPQLSFLSANVRELIKIDFLAALPSEVAFRILCFLDTTSLCKAAQVSSKWRQLADDDVVWHRMCEQHIERKCTKCGWGLPLLDRNKLRATKRQMQLRATGRGLNEWSPSITPLPETQEPSLQEDQSGFSDSARSSDGRLSPVLCKRTPLGKAASDYFRKTRPWKDVYKDRFKVGSNWKYGRCSIKVLKGHSNGVMALQFIDNILATGSYDSTIKIWDLDTGKELRTLRGHTMGIRCLQFDDTKLISGSLDKTLKVWNWRTGECLSTYMGHADGVISLHFDSNLLASGSSDHTARVWNFEDKSVFCLRGHTDWINSVKVDSASRTLFTASDDCTIKLWDLDTKKCIRTYEGHVGHVQQIVTLPPEFDADEEVVSSSESPTTEQEDSFQQGPVMHTQSTNSASPESELFSSQPTRPKPPRYILTSALDATIRLWETSTGRCIRTYFGHVEGVWAVAADTLRIVSGAHDRTVKVWDPRSGKSEKTFAGHAGPVTCIGLSDGRMCSGGEDGEVRVYNFTE